MLFFFEGDALAPYRYGECGGKGGVEELLVVDYMFHKSLRGRVFLVMDIQLYL